LGPNGLNDVLSALPEPSALPTCWTDQSCCPTHAWQLGSLELHHQVEQRTDSELTQERTNLDQQAPLDLDHFLLLEPPQCLQWVELEAWPLAQELDQPHSKNSLNHWCLQHHLAEHAMHEQKPWHAGELTAMARLEEN